MGNRVVEGEDFIPARIASQIGAHNAIVAAIMEAFEGRSIDGFVISKTEVEYLALEIVGRLRKLGAQGV